MSLSSSSSSSMDRYYLLSLATTILLLVVQSQLLISAKPGAKARKNITLGSLDNLEIEKVIPDVIDSKPPASAKIEWAPGVSAQLGNELTPTQVKDQPKISWDAKDDKMYLVAMVDPDAAVKVRQVVHTLIVNIPGQDITRGETLVEYIGAGPPKIVGLNRYVIVVYEQTKRVKSNIKTSKTSIKDRVNFSLRKFAKEHQLGDLVAANYFVAQYDDYVPQLHAQLASGMMKFFRWA